MNTIKAIALVLPLCFLLSACSDEDGEEYSERASSKSERIEDVSLPSAVLAAFTNGNPNATQVMWEEDGENYETTFTVNGMNKSIVFDAEGNALESEGEIEISSLLPSITGYIARNYTGYSITLAELSETQEASVFEVMLSRNGEEGVEVVFDASGNFVEAVEVEEGEEGSEMDEDGDGEEHEHGEHDNDDDDEG